jgi:ATP-binding cassette subfamily C (CFTR/MRP) protein 1
LTTGFAQLLANLCVRSVDGETDLLLQRIIREKFASHTVIAIVHKLESILDFDKVALLDGGELVEFDSPHALLSQPTSAFSQLYNSLVTERVEAVPSSIDSATGVGSSSTMSASSRS